MKLTSESKFFLGVIGLTFIIVGIAIAFLSKPVVPISREQLIPKGTNAVGNANSPVYVVEFADFECPACKTVQPTIDTLIKTYKDKVQFAYRYFPLAQHPRAVPAAHAAEAAAMQGKFWEMDSLLYQNQGNLSEETFVKLATELKLDIDTFNKDRNSDTVKRKVSDDLAAGNQLGVNATPTFYVNGIKQELLSFDDLKTAIDKALQNK
jgi:protein-disulfide isomerase